MPIIIHTNDETLKEVDLDADENRKLLSKAPIERRKIGASVCAIIHQNNLVREEKSKKFKIGEQVPTLREYIKAQVTTEVAQKKQNLLQAYQDVHGNVDEQAEVDKFSWPNPEDKDFFKLITKFKDLKCAALGTGFYVGNNLVVTAAHCVANLNPNNMGLYHLVFNYQDDEVPIYDVFNIGRIVHYNSKDQAPLAPNAPQFPQVDTLPVNAAQVNLAAMEQLSQTYDVAILEILPFSSDQKMPEALILQTTPAKEKTRVYSIGCSHGLPLIYADGSKGEEKKVKLAATVRCIPDPNLPLARQGSLTADIDVFKGNSGGPLFNAETNQVIGICRSGMIFPWLNTSVDEKNDKFINEVKKWAENKLQSPGLVLQPEYLNNYLQLRAIKENTRIAWIRFKGDSGAITQANAFSRTDPYALLITPPVNFRAEGGGLSIVVEIEALVDFFNPMEGDITLTITGPTIANKTETHDSSIQLGQGGWQGGSDLKWSLTTGGVAPVGGPLTGTLSENLLSWAGGICSWESISLKHISANPGGHQQSKVEPVRAKVTVSFFPKDPGHNGQFLRPFVFQIEQAKFNATGKTGVWVSPLGGRHGSTSAAWWTGPV
ncbi:trypsin-like cysteine/serine peptidase domain-containing protein [Xylaria cubensis]|nr:trypsin-like cysteine/serine peptidase domain-containing protein [Xylaria cubensis]